MCLLSCCLMPTALTKKSLRAAAEFLASKDRDLALVLEKYGPPPMWDREPGFATLVHIILEQQVSLASAASMFLRLNQNIVPLTPERFLELGEPHLKSLGLTRQKTAYCLDLSGQICGQELELTKLSRMSDEEVKTRLMRVKGIGLWSAEVYLLMVLKRPDIWPAGDLALVTAAHKLKRLKQRPTTSQMLRIGDRWRPYRSVAARMLWQYYLGERKPK